MRGLDSDIGVGSVEVFCVEEQQSRNKREFRSDRDSWDADMRKIRFETGCQRLCRNNAGIRVREIIPVAFIRDSGGTRMIDVRCVSKLRGSYGQVGV